MFDSPSPTESCRVRSARLDQLSEGVCLLRVDVRVGQHHTVPDAVEPDSWHGEVTLFDEIIINVPGPFPDEIAALAAIEVFRETR